MAGILTADDFFQADTELAVKAPKEVHKEPTRTLGESVCQVRFCTGGRLSAPPILHFRDYNMKASQSLAEIPDSKEHLPLIIDILNSMVVEDFDCGLLHLEEAKEVLLNVHAKWWGKFLSGYKYLINDTIEDEEKLLAKENISVAEIPLSGIEVKPLAEQIKEPISITVNGVTVKFIYPRLQNSRITSDLVKDHFAVEEQKFYSVQQKRNWNEIYKDPEAQKEIDLDESRAYDDYCLRRNQYDLDCTRAQLICEVDNEVLDTFEKRLDAIQNNSKITVKHWMKYNEFLKGIGDFGVQDEVKFYSEVKNDYIVRRFSFRSYSFIPDVPMEPARDESVEISFG